MGKVKGSVVAVAASGLSEANGNSLFPKTGHTHYDSINNKNLQFIIINNYRLHITILFNFRAGT